MTASISFWPVYKRGGDSVVAVDDPVLVAELDELDGRQGRELVHGLQDALPA